jgi:hypothetical protein
VETEEVQKSEQSKADCSVAQPTHDVSWLGEAGAAITFFLCIIIIKSRERVGMGKTRKEFPSIQQCDKKHFNDVHLFASAKYL